MTDQGVLPTAVDTATDTGPGAGAGSAEPGQRGSITIADGVVEHNARLVANEVNGVATVGSGLDKVVGRQYPKAAADVAGSRARLNV